MSLGLSMCPAVLMRLKPGPGQLTDLGIKYFMMVKKLETDFTFESIYILYNKPTDLRIELERFTRKKTFFKLSSSDHHTKY